MATASDILYIDAASGAAGNMFVAALLDLGVDTPAGLQAGLEGLGLDGWSLEFERVKRAGISAARFDVRVESGQPRRGWEDIRTLITASRLDGAVREESLNVFGRLAAAEAAAHGETATAVHFHEVGMVDSIIDIVGAVLLMKKLAPARVVCSPLALGSGTVKTMHGLMPVPAPATVNLLAGVPVREGEAGQELTTPTGAALAVHFADSFGPLPEMVLKESGYGAGSRETERPNLLRLILGQDGGIAGGTEVEDQVLIETNIDDSTPEQLAWLRDRLLDAGAADTWLAPLVMKKGRPGVLLSVLCRPQMQDALLDMVFRESSTFGARVSRVRRHCLERRFENAVTPYGEVRVKIGSWCGEDVTASPEYEDCRRLAEQHGVPLKRVYEAVRAARQD